MTRLHSCWLALLLLFCDAGLNAQARFDLAGPRIEIRVTRAGVTLPIATVPNLQPGDQLWLHPAFPETQSVHYLLIAAFLRGTTNPPPDNWFFRIETWKKEAREGISITVPAEAQQAILFLAPETGGDFPTLRSAVKGRPGIFVRAAQDLDEASFEQTRIEKYLDSMKRVPPGDQAALENHSNLLARTLNLKPNVDCYKRPLDQQYNCLTQTGTQTLLDDGHAQSIVAALSSGSNSDFINAASYTGLAGGGTYSAYVGALVDLIRVMNGIHTAQYQYIPALALPEQESLNLRLNTAPSFHNPKSVIVIGLPPIQAAALPPLRPAEPDHISCLLDPHMVLPIEGAPLVFSTGFAHGLVLHLNTAPAPGLPADLPLAADAYQGGLMLTAATPTRKELPLDQAAAAKPSAKTPPPASAAPTGMTTGTVQGFWGFAPFTGPTLPLQQLPGGGWHIVSGPDTPANLIAGQPNHLQLTSSGTACIRSVALEPGGAQPATPVAWKLSPRPAPPAPAPPVPPVDLTLNLQQAATPGSIRLAIQQYGQPEPDHLGTRTFAEPAKIESIAFHAGDQSLTLTGNSLEQVEAVSLHDQSYLPAAKLEAANPDPRTRTFALARDAHPATAKMGDRLTAEVRLVDGRTLPASTTVLAPRPVVNLLSGRISAAPPTPIQLNGITDLPLGATLTLFLKSKQAFPRAQTIEIAQAEVSPVPDTTQPSPEPATSSAVAEAPLHTTLSIAAGTLVLEDAHTVLATFDPLKTFGASTFGPFRLRALAPDGTPGDWMPLATIVRLPTLTDLRCPTNTGFSCQLSGTGLYLIDSVATDSSFSAPTRVPDGFVEPVLAIPHPAGQTFYLKLRDDPATIYPVTMPPQPESTTPHTPPHAAQARLAPGSSARRASISVSRRQG